MNLVSLLIWTFFAFIFLAVNISYSTTGHNKKSLKYNQILFFFVLAFAVFGQGVYYNLNVHEAADGSIQLQTKFIDTIPLYSIVSFVISLFFFGFFSLVYFDPIASAEFWNLLPSLLLILSSILLAVLSYILCIVSIFVTSAIRSLWLIIPLAATPIWIVFTLVILFDVFLKKYFKQNDLFTTTTKKETSTTSD
jgi:hypothetical protein